jgi:hypothetical protein
VSWSEGKRLSWLLLQHFRVYFLQAVKELDPASLLPNKPHDNAIEVLTGEILEADDKIATLKARILHEKNLGTLVDVLLQLEQAKNEKVRRRDELLIAKNERSTDDLKEAVSLIEVLEQQQDDPTLRERLRNKVRQLVSEIWMIVDATGKRGRTSIRCLQRTATAQVFFRSGGFRIIQISTGSEGMVGETITGKTGLDLRQWRFED